MNRYEQVMRKLRGKPIGFPRASPMHLGDQDLVEIERRLGEGLPSDYREFIRDFGHFVVPMALFECYLEGVLMGGSVVTFRGFRVGEDSRSDIIDSYEDACESFEEWPHDCIPIGSDSGSSSVVLAFKGERKGQVFFVNSEAELCDVASNFDEFMHMLRLYEDDPETRILAERFWKPYLGEE